MEGVRFELNCSLGIYSEATINSITWTSSDNEITDTRDEDSLMLTFDPLTSDDAGIYACSIIFDTTTITKSYELAPRVGELIYKITYFLLEPQHSVSYTSVVPE